MLFCLHLYKIWFCFASILCLAFKSVAKQKKRRKKSLTIFFLCFFVPSFHYYQMLLLFCYLFTFKAKNNNNNFFLSFASDVNAKRVFLFSFFSLADKFNVLLFTIAIFLCQAHFFFFRCSLSLIQSYKQWSSNKLCMVFNIFICVYLYNISRMFHVHSFIRLKQIIRFRFILIKKIFFYRH